MKNKILLFITTLFAVVSCQAAAIYLVDFNQQASGTHPGGVAEWNVYANPGAISGGTLLHDTTGDTSGVVIMDYSGTMSDSSNAASNNNGPSWVYTTGNTGAAGDYFFTSTLTGSQIFTVTLNLHEGDVAALDLFASRNSGVAHGRYSYSTDGGSSWTGFNVLQEDGSPETLAGWDTLTTLDQAFHNQTDGWNQGRSMNATGITIGALGTLQIRVQDATSINGDYTVLNAFRLTLDSQFVLPEPSSLGLLLGGAGLILKLRRRARIR